MEELSIFCRAFAESILSQCVERNNNSNMEFVVKNVPTFCTAADNYVRLRNAWKLF